MATVTQTFREPAGPFAEKVLRITMATFERSMDVCPQCGMGVVIHPAPGVNGRKRAGHELCYGCEWANECLSGRPHAGESFKAFCDRKGYTI
jgi:hypothetical protein